MIYEINDKYYIRISSLKYKEIKMELVNDDVKVVATNNTLEANGQMVINQIDFQKEKNKFKELLLEEMRNEETEEEPVIEPRRYNNKRYR